MRFILSALLCLAIAAPAMAQKGEDPDDLVPPGVNSLEFYSDAEERLLTERQSLLDQESALSLPLWVGAPGERIFILEEVEYRRILELLRDWANSDFFEPRDIEYLPSLDRYLFESLGIEAIANMDGTALEVLVEQARVNRQRLLSVYEAAISYAQARFDYHSALASYSERPDIYQVYDTTYGEIHWQEGYYNVPNNTIEIEDIYEDRDRAGWVVVGRWGREDDADTHGGFEFLFSSACQFAGRWWYTGSDAGVSENWTGECQ